MLYCPDCYEPIDNADEPCPKCNYKAKPSLLNEKVTSERPGPSPRFAADAEFTGSTAKNKKKYLIVASLVALLLLAREGGFVNWYLFRFNADSETQTLLQGNQYIQSGGTFTYATRSKNVNSAFTTEGRSWGLGFQLLGGSPLAVDLKEEIQNNLNQQTQVRASVEHVELTGLYWLPFIKSGSCKYRVRLQVAGNDSIVYAGVLNGVTDYDFSGLCSVRTLKQTLGSEIARRVVKSVDDVIR